MTQNDDFYVISISDKCCSFWTLCSTKNPKECSFSQNIKQHW